MKRCIVLKCRSVQNHNAPTRTTLSSGPLIILLKYSWYYKTKANYVGFRIQKSHLSVPLWMWLECGDDSTVESVPRDDCSFVLINKPDRTYEKRHQTNVIPAVTGACQERSDLPSEPTTTTTTTPVQKSPECTTQKHHQGNRHSLSCMLIYSC